MLKVRTDTTRENSYHTIVGAQFADGDKQQVLVEFLNPVDESLDATEYRRTAEGTWQTVRLMKGGANAEQGGLSITVKQGIDDPPMLVATNKQVSRVIWDPNPQLKNFRMGQASVYKWRDKEGREWRGGLYLPSEYKTGQRYPLVIQNHGFDELKFLPSGVFPTAFAARSLAAQGIAVLQAGAGSGNCHIETVDEGPCMVAGYESAAKQLISEGLVDPENIGIIGFSRTCFYVMEAITTDSFHFKAASVSDGVMVLYSDFLLQPERLGPAFSSMVGASPFGEGMQQWLKRSPSFKFDKVNTPLLINTGSGNWGVLAMWEPYAVLHYLHKPVDLMVLNTDEHVLTNPAVRMASQGGTVDWFRFWLKNEEDTDPAKTDQYARWRELRKLR